MTEAPSLSNTVQYRARFDECGPDGVLRSSGYLRWAQDAAWIHSERLGFTRSWYADRGLWWFVRCAELNLLADVAMGETVTVTTTIVGYRKIWVRRRTEVQRASGNPAATALTDWVITDVRGAPTRVPAEFFSLFSARMDTFTPGRVLLPPTPPAAAREQVSVRLADIDPLAHVNSAAYIDYLDEALGDAGAEWLERLPRRYRLEYVAPVEPGTSIKSELWPTADGVAFRLTGADGTERLRASLDGRTGNDDFRQTVAARRAWRAPGKDTGAG